MKKEKRVKLSDGKEIIVFELTVRQLLSAQEQVATLADGNVTKDSITAIMTQILPDCTQGISSTEEMFDYCPSELSELMEAFQEVNAVFLSILEKLGIKKQIQNVFKMNLDTDGAVKEKEEPPKAK
jgi:hypothetical protein